MHRNENSESISVNAIFGKEVNDIEAKLLSKSKTILKRVDLSSYFKNFITAEVKKNIDKYPHFKNELSKKKNSIFAKTSEDIYDELSDYFVAQNLDVYFPYEEIFELINVNQFTITWDPLTDQLTNSGYTASLISNQSKLSSTSKLVSDLKPISGISDNYAFENPTLVVRPSTPLETFVEQAEQHSYNTSFANTPPLIGHFKGGRDY